MNPLANLQNFNIAGNAQNALLQGMQTGDAMRQRKERREREVALDKAYQGMMAGDQTAVNALAAIPGMGKDAYTLQQGQRERDVKMRAAQGDKAAIAELAGIDWESWTKIGQRDKDAMKARNDYIGNAALRISQAPEAQRPQLWDAAVEQGIALGYTDLAGYRGQYNPQSVEALIANSGQIAKLFELERPSYMAPVDGAPLINVKDPAAVNAWNSGGQASSPVKVTTIDEARALPPGTRFIDPNGVERTVPGGGAASNGGGNFPGWY